MWKNYRHLDRIRRLEDRASLLNMFQLLRFAGYMTYANTYTVNTLSSTSDVTREEADKEWASCCTYARPLKREIDLLNRHRAEKKRLT